MLLQDRAIAIIGIIQLQLLEADDVAQRQFIAQLDVRRVGNAPGLGTREDIDAQSGLART